MSNPKYNLLIEICLARKNMKLVSIFPKIILYLMVHNLKLFESCMVPFLCLFASF